MSVRKSYRTRLYELALSNNGLATTEMAKEIGIPAVELRKLASRGAIIRVAQGVYRSPFHPEDATSKFHQALAVAGPGSFLIAESVLALLGIAEFKTASVSVGVTKRIRKQLPPGLSIRFYSQAPAIELVKGIPCQSVASVFRAQRELLAPQDYASVAMQLKQLRLLDVL